MRRLWSFTVNSSSKSVNFGHAIADLEMTSDLGITTGGRIVVSPYNSCDLGGLEPPFFLRNRVDLAIPASLASIPST